MRFTRTSRQRRRAKRFDQKGANTAAENTHAHNHEGRTETQIKIMFTMHRGVLEGTEKGRGGDCS
jgi:hypothetical protein